MSPGRKWSSIAVDVGCGRSAPESTVDGESLGVSHPYVSRQISASLPYPELSADDEFTRLLSVEFGVDTRPIAASVAPLCLFERVPRHQRQRNGAMTKGSKHVEPRHARNSPIAVGLGVLGCGRHSSRRKMASNDIASDAAEGDICSCVPRIGP